MSKTGFSLQVAQFSDSDSQTPMQTIINSYDRQYSLIYQQIKSFLKECKDNINKYIQLNQFGARFNMYSLYVQMTSIETSALNGISDVRKQQLQHEKDLKNKYEKQFENIIARMESVIKDFLKFEVDFKKEYFGWNIAQPETKTKAKSVKPFKNSVLGKLSSEHSSFGSGESRSKKPLSISVEDEKKETQLQQKLREILKRKLAPQKQNIIKFCDKQSDPYKNMLKLEQKIDMMQSQLILSRTREEKIIDIFNKRRTENLQPKGQNLLHNELIQTDDGTGRHKMVDDSLKNVGKGNGKRENSCDGLESQFKHNKSFKKLHLLSKPSLNMQAINKGGDFSGEVSPKVIPQSNNSTPRKLISPKGVKSPLSKNPSKQNFFCSPNKLFVRDKNPTVDFKKKRQPQDQETHSSMQQKYGNFHQKQLNSKQKKQLNSRQKTNHNPNSKNGGHGLSSNNNREQFMLRRKNNHGEISNAGGVNLIE